MKKIIVLLLTIFFTFAGVFADGADLWLYCGITVPRSEFVYPDNSERRYNWSEFDQLFTGNAKERYFKSQIFIDEIFVRYGYDFSEKRRAPGKVIISRYQDKAWYQTAINSCPAQDMDKLMNQYMSSIETDNIYLVNKWQADTAVEEFDNPNEIQIPAWTGADNSSVSSNDTTPDNTPVQETAVQETAVEETAVQETSVQETPVESEEIQDVPEEAKPAEVEEIKETYVDRITPDEEYLARDFRSVGSEESILLSTEDNGVMTLSAGKSKMNLPEGAFVLYYHYNNDATFLIVDSGKYESAGKVLFLSMDDKGSLNNSSEAVGAYTNVHMDHIDQEGLIYLKTGPYAPGDTISFKNISGEMFRVTETYYINPEKHEIYRKSNYGTFDAGVEYYYSGTSPVALSTSEAEYNANGPILNPGDKVEFSRVYFEFIGNDASTCNYIYEISFGGGKGWIREESSVQFMDEYVPDGEEEIVSSAPIAEYNGKVYWIYSGLSVANIEPCPAVAAQYDYICSMAFYGGKLYYCCKEAGTSGYRMAIFRCNPDGTEHERLAAPLDSEPYLDTFAMKDGWLYYYITKQNAAPCYRLNLQTLETETLYSNAEIPEDVYHVLIDYRYYKGQDYYYTVWTGEGQNSDFIVKRSANGEDITLVQDTTVYLCAVIGKDLYYSSYVRDRNEFVLYKKDLETGAVQELHSKKAAGGGGYFNW